MSDQHSPARPAEPETGRWQPATLDLIEFRRDQAAHVLAARIPARFVDARVDHPGIAAWVNSYLTDPANAPSLVVSGPTGTGKTHACWAAIRAIVEGLADRGRAAQWRAISHPDLNAALRPKVDGSHNTALQQYMQAGLLFLDDLGAGKSTDWTEDTLYRLVDHRWANRLTTIYSTNLPRQSLAGVVGERVVSRLGDAVRVTIAGQDRRWKAA